MKYLIYPTIFGSFTAAIIYLAESGLNHWLLFIGTIAVGGSTMLVLERTIPYHAVWRFSVGDLGSDIIHSIVNFALISSIFIAFQPIIELLFQYQGLWNNQWPFALQVLLAGIVIDLGMYAIHRLSHILPFLWKLHAVHHSSKRIYWLNSEKRHPIHAALEGTPGLLILLLLKANPQAVTTWFLILNIHLMFQHANINYRVGILKFVFLVAELHRWHHRGDYATDAQVNYGAVFSFWDYLFGSAYREAALQEIKPNDVGIFEEPNFPQTYLAQLKYPFKKT